MGTEVVALLSVPEESVVGTDSIDRISPTRRPNERVVMRQRWRNLLFLHWRVAPEMLQPLVPSGLTIDTFGGDAYIGLVPFTMRDVRPVWSPSVPFLSHFHETNVRTYVHRAGHEPGVWFFSLDAANWIAVQIARALFKLPYYDSRMEIRKNDDSMEYISTRLHTGANPPASHVRCRPTGTPTASKPNTLEFFLAERYVLYSAKGKKLYRGRVHHTPYQMQNAAVDYVQDSLVQAAGVMVDDPSRPHLAHYAEGVDVEVFPLQFVGE